MFYSWKNLNMLPSLVASKRFINELDRLLNLWTNEKLSLKKGVIKSIQVTPSKSSKPKSNPNERERRLKLQEERKMLQILEKSRTIRERLPSSNTPLNIKKSSSKFKQMMQKGNVNDALILLSNVMELWNRYKQNNPKQKFLIQKIYCGGLKKPIHSVVFDDINKGFVLKATIKSEGECGQSGLDADNSWRILTSHSYSLDLEKVFCKLCFKSIGIKNIHISKAGLDNSLETFTTSCLILLDKNS